MPAQPETTRRIMLLGASGTIGQATARALVARGHEVVCFVRPPSAARVPEGAEARVGEVTDRASLSREGFRGERFDALVSCLASRTGEPGDARRIDYQAHVDALDLAREAGVSQVVLLSALCVQKPKLAFQKAKLAFEDELIASGLTYSIVRPTAFFKSLSGQVERVKAGKPYLMFGDGELTACKPISDDDLASYLADCLDDERLQNRILPIGGPGPAITPKEQGEHLFALLGRKPRYSRVPPGFLLVIARILSALASVHPPLAARAAYARIGHYYATESMLVLDPETGRYSEDLTPSTGTETLFQHYEKLVREGSDQVA